MAHSIVVSFLCVKSTLPYGQQLSVDYLIKYSKTFAGKESALESFTPNFFIRSTKPQNVLGLMDVRYSEEIIINLSNSCTKPEKY